MRSETQPYSTVLPLQQLWQNVNLGLRVSNRQQWNYNPGKKFVASSQKYSTPPVTADTLCPRGISTECFEKLVSSISNGGKMLHFVYFVYIFF